MLVYLGLFDDELHISFLFDYFWFLESDCAHYHVLFGLGHFVGDFYPFSVASCTNSLFFVLESFNVVADGRAFVAD